MRRFLPASNRSATIASSRRRYDMARSARRLRIESLEDRRMLATIVVSSTADNGANTLRAAIAQANLDPDADTIEFSSLFDTAQTILLTSGELAITNPLTINGPGADLLTIDASGNDPTPLVKDGAGSRVFNIDDGSFDLIEVTLSGITITGGDIGGFSEPAPNFRDLQTSGGGILSNENLRIDASTIENNAVVALLGADVLDPPYESGDSLLDGGGIFASGILTISNSTIKSNLVKADYHGAKVGTDAPSIDLSGGGVSAIAATLIIDNSVISENQVLGDFTNLKSAQFPPDDVRGFQPDVRGGGVSALASTMTLTRSFVHSNEVRLKADQIGADGRDNTVRIRGGGIFASGLGTTSIDTTTISDNSGVHDFRFLPGTHWLEMNSEGGGAWILDSRVVNSTISGNALTTIFRDDDNFSTGSTEGTQVKSWGAGLYISGNSQVIHSTIASNRLESETDNMDIAHAGAGLWSNGGIAVIHTLLGNNTINELFRRDSENPNDDEEFTSPEDLSTRARGFAGPLPDPAEITVTYSLVETYDVIFSATSDNNILDVDPLLGPLQNNGGFLLPDGSRILTHALLPDSPAIDAGDPTLVAGVGDTPEFDQRGVPFDRVIDAPGTPQIGPVIDIGAVEYGYSADANGDGFVDGGDFLAWQRGFGTTSGATREDGDFDGNGDVDSHDLDIWRAMFGSTPSPVDEGMALALALSPNLPSETGRTIAPLDSPPSPPAAVAEPVPAVEPESAIVGAPFEAALAGLTYPRIKELPRAPHVRAEQSADNVVRAWTNVEPTLHLRRWDARGEELEELLDDSTILHHDESPVDWFDDAFELL